MKHLEDKKKTQHDMKLRSLLKDGNHISGTRHAWQHFFWLPISLGPQE